MIHTSGAIIHLLGAPDGNNKYVLNELYITVQYIGILFQIQLLSRLPTRWTLLKKLLHASEYQPLSLHHHELANYFVPSHLSPNRRCSSPRRPTQLNYALVPTSSRVLSPETDHQVQFGPVGNTTLYRLWP